MGGYGIDLKSTGIAFGGGAGVSRLASSGKSSYSNCMLSVDQGKYYLVLIMSEEIR